MDLKLCYNKSEICNKTQELLNGIIENYRKILLKKEPSLRILTHSGSAPIEGWINCISGNNTISEAIHDRAINSRSHAEQHFRDNYVWHAWLRNNLEYFIYKHDGIHNLPILNKIKILGFDSIPIKEGSSSIIDPMSNIERFKKVFTKFNNSYPYIGLLHRCLIISRFFNEKYLLNNIEKATELQNIYYPLFYFINLFIHIAMFYSSLDTANFDAIIKAPRFANNNFETFIKKAKGNPEIITLKEYVNIKEEDFNDKYSEKFLELKQTLLNILKKFYGYISDLYIPIKELIQLIIEKDMIVDIDKRTKLKKNVTIKIDKLDKVYFDASVSATTSASASARNNSTARNNSRVILASTISSVASAKTLTPRTNKKLKFKDMGFNKLLINNSINNSINNNPDTSINTHIFGLLREQDKQDSPTPHPSSIGYGDLSSVVSSPRNNKLNLSRDYIISILAGFGITESNTSFITENMVDIIEKLLSKIHGYKERGLSTEKKNEISRLYEMMLQEYLEDGYHKGRELNTGFTQMNIVKNILKENGYSIPTEIIQQKIFTINALVKEILNILVRN